MLSVVIRLKCSLERCVCVCVVVKVLYSIFVRVHTHFTFVEPLAVIFTHLRDTYACLCSLHTKQHTDSILNRGAHTEQTHTHTAVVLAASATPTRDNRSAEMHAVCLSKCAHAHKENASQPTLSAQIVSWCTFAILHLYMYTSEQLLGDDLQHFSFSNGTIIRWLLLNSTEMCPYTFCFYFLILNRLYWLLFSLDTCKMTTIDEKTISKHFLKKCISTHMYCIARVNSRRSAGTRHTRRRLCRLEPAHKLTHTNTFAVAGNDLIKQVACAFWAGNFLWKNEWGSVCVRRVSV